MAAKAKKLEFLLGEQRYVYARLGELSISGDASASTLRASLNKKKEELTTKINALLHSSEEEMPKYGGSSWEDLLAGLHELDENDKKYAEKSELSMTQDIRAYKSKGEVKLDDKINGTTGGSAYQEHMRKLEEVLASGNFPDEAEMVNTVFGEHLQKKRRERDDDPQPPADDNYFVGELQTLKDGVQDWAATYALRDLQQWRNVQRQRPRGLYETLGHVAVIGGVPDGLKSDIRAPEVFLSALLSYELCVNVVGEPFLVHPAFRDVYKNVQCESLSGTVWMASY